jgi:hypothetical protein
LRALVRAVSPLSDDRPTIQYPFAPITAWPNYARLFRHAPSKPGALLSREPEPALRGQIDQVALALSRVLPTLHLSETGSAERRELVTGNAVRSALAARPNDEALLGLLSVQFDRVHLANDVFAELDAVRLLREGPQAAVEQGPPEPIKLPTMLHGHWRAAPSTRATTRVRSTSWQVSRRSRNKHPGTPCYAQVACVRSVATQSLRRPANGRPCFNRRCLSSSLGSSSRSLRRATSRSS